MTRQITIDHKGHHLMLDISFERHENYTSYIVCPNKHFNGAIPEDFQLTIADESDDISYNESDLSEDGQQIAKAISERIRQFPPQFRGGKGEGKI